MYGINKKLQLGINFTLKCYTIKQNKNNYLGIGRQEEENKTPYTILKE